jgi:hypothetical protein
VVVLQFPSENTILYQKAVDAGVHVILHLLPRVTELAEVIVDALGMVSRDTRPEQEVEVSVVLGIDPVADMVMALVPSPLWLTVFVAVIASTQPLAVMVKCVDADWLCPSIVT